MAEQLLFESGGALFAAPLEQLDGVAHLTQVVPLPGAPRHLWGLTNRRGYLVPVFDAAPLLGRAPGGRRPAYVVVLKLEGTLVGIGADQPPTVTDTADERVHLVTAEALTEALTIREAV
jgi:chemotaxis signal transduction protein